jgi:hypothetical protein
MALILSGDERRRTGSGLPAVGALAMTSRMEKLFGLPLFPLVTIRDGYDDLDGAGLVILAADVNENAGGATHRSDPAGRLRLLDANVTVFETIAPQLGKAAQSARAGDRRHPPSHRP